MIGLRFFAFVLVLSLVGCAESSDSTNITEIQAETYEPPIGAAQDTESEDEGILPDTYPAYDAYARELERQEIADAKRAVVDAQYDLDRSVRNLSYGDWENDLPTVQRRLRALEDANSQLSSVDSSAASDMDWEISRMQRELRRLEDENWRDVVPDIEQRNRSVGWESDNIESSIDE